MKCLTHSQEIPRFAFHGRYSTDVLVQNSWIIDIIHSHNEWEPSPLASHHSLAVPGIPIEQNSTTILQVCISLILSVSERSYRRCVATRREPIPLETGDKRKEPNITGWENCVQ